MKHGESENATLMLMPPRKLLFLNIKTELWPA